MIIQCDPLVPLETPKGPAMAHFLIDFGIEHSLQFVCFVDETGECWTFNQQDVRLQHNLTQGRPPREHTFSSHWRKQ